MRPGQLGHTAAVHMVTNAKFAALLNGSLYDGTLVCSDDAEIRDFVRFVSKHVHTHAYERSPPKPKAFEDEVRMLLLNLLQVWWSDPTAYVVINNGKETIHEPKSARMFDRALAGLLGAGLIDKEVGFKDKKSGKGYKTRIRATEQLLLMAIELGVQPEMIRKAPRPLIELRSTKDECGHAKLCRWPRSERELFEVIQRNLLSINDQISRSLVVLHVSNACLLDINRELRRKKEESSWVDFRDIQLRRIFNDGKTTLGGRFNGGWWQNIPSRYRKYIQIANPRRGVPHYTVELDYSSMQPRLLYARARIEPPEDCYAFSEWFRTNPAARAYAKATLLILLNSGSRPEAIKALNNQVMETFDEQWTLANPGKRRGPMKIPQMVPAGCPGISDMLDEIVTLHAPISEYFYTGVGKELARVESDIAERVMLQMKALDITVLPIHDSFIVSKGACHSLELAMEQAFFDLAGTKCVIKADVTEHQERATGKAFEAPSIVEIVQRLKGECETHSIYWKMREQWEMSHTRRTPAETGMMAAGAEEVVLNFPTSITEL